MRRPRWRTCCETTVDCFGFRYRISVYRRDVSAWAEFQPRSKFPSRKAPTRREFSARSNGLLIPCNRNEISAQAEEATILRLHCDLGSGNTTNFVCCDGDFPNCKSLKVQARLNFAIQSDKLSFPG